MEKRRLDPATFVVELAPVEIHSLLIDLSGVAVARGRPIDPATFVVEIHTFVIDFDHTFHEIVDV